jgi:RNA polymerase sigma-70 factor (ECF subfamily)
MDATQNVFLVVYRKLPEFEGRAQLRTWIFQICRRVASDYRRSAPIRREVITDITELTERTDRERAAAPGADQAARVRLARSILDRLTENQREVFILYELEGLSGEEIAQRLDIPLGTVRSRLRLARRSFRTQVEALVEQPRKQEVG